MASQEIKAGMFVEYHMSLSEVIAVKPDAKHVEIQRHSDNQKMIVDIDELFIDRTLNSDSDMYYWGC